MIFVKKRINLQYPITKSLNAYLVAQKKKKKLNAKRHADEKISSYILFPFLHSEAENVMNTLQALCITYYKIGRIF